MRGARKFALRCIILCAGVFAVAFVCSLTKRNQQIWDTSTGNESTDVPVLTEEKTYELLYIICLLYGMLQREAETDMDVRRQLVERVCRQYNLGLYRHSAEPSIFKHPPTPQYSVFYIDRPHKMSWCPIYKAASSTWLHQLLLLAGHTDEVIRTSKKQLSVIARMVYPVPDNEIAEEAFRTTLKILIVRHPFERLLSAYRDKLENKDSGIGHGTLHFYKSYGQKIVKKFRNSTQHIERLEPTFREFVVYLTREDPIRFDDHWIPYYLFCTPCLVRYDVIAHVETFFRDQVYMIRTVGLDGIIEPRWKHLTKGRRSSGDTAKKYFSTLSRSQVQQLYNVYRLDFELFGYKPDEYFDYATAL